MNFQYNDGGRAAAGYKGSAGDCVVRAVAIATEQPYQVVYDALSHGMREQRVTKGRYKGSARNGVSVKRKWFKDYMEQLGWKWTPTMKIGSGCKVHLNAKELPAGRLVVRVSHHVAAVIDGVLHDTYNSSERGTTIYPKGCPIPVPKNAVWLENGNGWAYTPERCVYGYWRQV